MGIKSKDQLKGNTGRWWTDMICFLYVAVW